MISGHRRILALILADSTRHRYHLASFLLSVRVYAFFEKTFAASLKAIRRGIFISTNRHDSLLITILLIVNSDGSPPHSSVSACIEPHVDARLQKYASAAAVTYRLNEGKHSRGSVISIITPRKRNRTRKIFIFCTAVNDESNRRNVRPATAMYRLKHLIWWRLS